MGIEYLRAKTVMNAANKSLPSRQRDRFEFAKKLVSLMLQKKHVIIADETSTSLWARPALNHTW